MNYSDTNFRVTWIQRPKTKERVLQLFSRSFYLNGVGRYFSFSINCYFPSHSEFKRLLNSVLISLQSLDIH